MNEWLWLHFFNDAGLVEEKGGQKIKELDELSARLLLPTGGQTANPLVILRRWNKKKQENDQRAKTGVYNFHTIGNSVATTFQTNKQN